MQEGELFAQGCRRIISLHKTSSYLVLEWWWKLRTRFGSCAIVSISIASSPLTMWLYTCSHISCSLSILEQESSKNNRSLNIVEKLKPWMIDAGFRDVQVRAYKVCMLSPIVRNSITKLTLSCTVPMESLAKRFPSERNRPLSVHKCHWICGLVRSRAYDTRRRLYRRSSEDLLSYREEPASKQIATCIQSYVSHYMVIGL